MEQKLVVLGILENFQKLNRLVFRTVQNLKHNREPENSEHELI
jgi:hypothetical protein